ncbi:MAG: alpha/beta hydrolase [Chloroflexota bacterium]
MPTVHVNGVTLYYEEQGAGPNLVLIEGLGYHTWMWYRQLPIFKRYFRTLIYDNRGVGRSDKPPGPYNHAQNADDLAALLTYLEWDTAHVLGVSMGGFIALQFALRYPERLNKLVLVATGFGGKNMVQVPPEAMRALIPDPEQSPEQRIRTGMPIAFGNRQWIRENHAEFEQIIQWRLEHPQPVAAAVAQAQAGLSFDVEGRLSEIAAPTLVLAGSEDRVVPPRNAELLAEKIQNARLGMMPDAGHLVFIEQAERFNAAVLQFLQDEQAGSIDAPGMVGHSSGDQ